MLPFSKRPVSQQLAMRGALTRVSTPPPRTPPPILLWAAVVSGLFVAASSI